MNKLFLLATCFLFSCPNSSFAMDAAEGTEQGESSYSRKRKPEVLESAAKRRRIQYVVTIHNINIPEKLNGMETDVRLSFSQTNALGGPVPDIEPNYCTLPPCGQTKTILVENCSHLVQLYMYSMEYGDMNASRSLYVNPDGLPPAIRVGYNPDPLGNYDVLQLEVEYPKKI